MKRSVNPLAFDPHTIPSAKVDQLASVISRYLGLWFPQSRHDDLLRNIQPICQKAGYRDLDSLVDSVLATPPSGKMLQLLVQHLTVGETYFFRDKYALNALSSGVLPQLIDTRRRTDRSLTIWSAGCCTGEEPYTIAMILDQLIVDIEQWKITILATDVNEAFLRKASAGTYSEWSFRETPASALRKYFRAEGRLHHVVPRIQSSVKICSLNLRAETYPAPFDRPASFDLIVCRNVLMYFSSMEAAAVTQKFQAALREDGWLVLGPNEISLAHTAGFISVGFEGAFLHRKTETPGASERPRVVVGMPIAEPLKVMGEEHPPPSVGESRFGLAQALYEKGCYAQVVETLVGQAMNVGAATATSPLEAREAALLARAYANIGQLDAALQWCVTAMNADKLNPAIRFLFASVLQERGDIDGAFRELKRTLYLEPDCALAHFALANVARRLERQHESDRHLRIALSLLQRFPPEAIVPESDGLAAATLAQTIRTLLAAPAASGCK